LKQDIPLNYNIEKLFCWNLRLQMSDEEANKLCWFRYSKARPTGASDGNDREEHPQKLQIRWDTHSELNSSCKTIRSMPTCPLSSSSSTRRRATAERGIMFCGGPSGHNAAPAVADESTTFGGSLRAQRRREAVGSPPNRSTSPPSADFLERDVSSMRWDETRGDARGELQSTDAGRGIGCTAGWFPDFVGGFLQTDRDVPTDLPPIAVLLVEITGFENITRYGYFYCQNQVLCSKIPHISIGHIMSY
jgi:hypothetical protein